MHFDALSCPLPLSEVIRRRMVRASRTMDKAGSGRAKSDMEQHRRSTITSSELERSNSRGNSLIRSRIQRRRAAEGKSLGPLRRSLSCDDVKYLASRCPSPLGDRTLWPSSSSGRVRTCSGKTITASDDDPQILSLDVAATTTTAAEKKSRRKRTRADKKPRTRRHTKTLTFPANSLLHYAVAENDESLTERLLTDSTSNVNQLSVDGTAPLHEAAMNGSVRCIGILMKYGAQVDVKDCEGHTPLEYAVFAGQFDSAASLIEHGASVDKIRDGLTL